MKNRNKYSISRLVISVFATLLLAVMPTIVTAQGVNPQLAKKVRHELVTLPYYGVFDNLAYSINGGTVTLYGQVVRSSTRSDAAGRVKRIAGVTRVVNNIEVLPLSGTTHLASDETVAENLLLLQVDFLKRSLGL